MFFVAFLNCPTFTDNNCCDKTRTYSYKDPWSRLQKNHSFGTNNIDWWGKGKAHCQLAPIKRLLQLLSLLSELRKIVCVP